MHVWLNGSIVDPDQARVRVDDHGLVVGDGAFSTLKVIRGEPFAITRHLQRLYRNLDALAIPRPDEQVLRGAAREAIAASGLDDARLRLTVTGGSGSLGSGAPAGPASIIAIVSALSAPAPPTAITVPWTRNEHGALAGLKTTSYAENVRMLRAAHDAGAGEALMANTAGELCEGTGTNVFLVMGGEVLTPPLSAGCLDGISRQLVMENFAVTERELPFELLFEADEVFLTSSMRHVQGLTRIDDRELNVGPRTEHVAKIFADLVDTTLDP